jgi:hypothetical protein
MRLALPLYHLHCATTVHVACPSSSLPAQWAIPRSPPPPRRAHPACTVFSGSQGNSRGAVVGDPLGRWRRVLWM